MLSSLFSISSWTETFPDIDPSLTKEGESNRIVYTGTGGIWVKDCAFSNLSSSERGAAIESTSATHLLVESSLFSYMVTFHDRGGGVYYYNAENGQYALERVCSYSCECGYKWSSYGQFCYMCAKGVDSAKNSLHDSSVIRTDPSVIYTDPSGSKPYQAVYFYYGNISICRANISFNRGVYETAFSVGPTISSDTKTKATCRVSFSSIANNTAKIDKILRFNTDAYYDMIQCNVINNTAPTYIFFDSGYLNISGSCIINNNADTMFFSDKINGISISMCTIDKWSCNAVIKFSPNQDASFIVSLDIFKTAECDETPIKIRKTLHIRRKYQRLFGFKFIFIYFVSLVSPLV